MSAADPTRVFVDGRVVAGGDARVPVLDRGFLYGDSIYEVTRTFGGKPFALDEHLRRLAASAAGLAMGLAWLYPRGRVLFLLLAISAGGQRIVSGDHFASDVVWGAALGCFCATGLFDGGLLAGFFTRLESRWRPSVSVVSEIVVWKRR